MTPKESCPSTTQLKGLLDGQAPADQQTVLAGHLETCESCRQTLEELVAGSESWSDAARQLKEEPPAAAANLRQIMDKIKQEAKAADTQDAAPASEEVALDFLNPPENPEHLGRLGHYEILEVIGRGGMGVVLKGFDTELRRIVAIKVLAPQLATTSAARKRFEREGQAAAAIDHEHVVAIYAVDKTTTELPYIVMEYVAGLSLQDRLDRSGPLELKEILRIGLQTARGLAAAHAQGLVHRDIKPANILLYNGVERVKITDFGLARAVDDASLTQSGIVAGTPHFMAPEQARGEAVDHRADLFSLGSVLYAMCTGRPPFRASTALAVLKRVSEETPRPLPQINPAIPAWLVEIIEKLHAKDPADRFQSAAEVAELLGQHLAHLQQPANVPLPPSLRPKETTKVSKTSEVFASGGVRRWAVAAILLPLIAGGFVVTEATGITNVTEYVGTVLRIRTAEGTLVVQVDDPDVKISIDGEEITITGAGPQEIRLKPGKYHVQATKDGKEIPLDKDLVTITRGGKQIVKISQEGAGRPSAGAVSQSPALSTHLDFGDYQVRFKDTLQAHTDIIWSVVFSPDGKLLATTSGELWDHPGEIRVWNVETKKMVWSRKEQSVVRSAAFSPGGMNLATGEFDGTVRIWSADKGAPQGAIRGHTKAVNSVAFSPDGQTLASGSWDKTVKIWKWATGKLLDTFDSGNTDSVYSVAFSPDGKTLAVGGRDQGEHHTARLFDPLETTNPAAPIHWAPRVTLVGHTGRIEFVAFSPDGELLATASWDGTVKLWKVADGKELITLRGHSYAVYCVAFSPDRKLLATASADKTVKLWDVARRKEWVPARPDGRNEVGGKIEMLKDIITGKLLTTLSGHSDKVYAVAFSPDGKTLASASWDHTVKLWEISSNQPPSAGKVEETEKKSAGATKDSRPPVRQLLQQRYAILKQLEEEVERKFQLGEVSEDEVVLGRLAVFKAALKLAESDPERVKIQQEIVAQMKRLEEILNQRFQAGRILQTDVLKARAELLQAEKELQELRQKSPQSAKPKG